MNENERKQTAEKKSAPAKETKDVASSSNKSEKLKKFFMDNNKRNLKIIAAVVAVILVLALVAGGIFVGQKLGLININSGDGGNENATFEDEDQFKAMYDLVDTQNLEALVKSWATNGGEKYSSKNVINVLVIGATSDNGSATSLSDSIMLVSLNKKTKTITVASFLRDSYTYMDINGEDRCDKTNHSHSWGGAAKLIEVLENNYKIEIDHYVSADFASFPKIIDALGGIEVPITVDEANYINRTTTKIPKVTSGDRVKLNGAQALVFCRIRKDDGKGDLRRTERQRMVISMLIEKARTASVGQLNNALNLILPNVVTNYKKSEILSLMTQALSQNWMNYEIKQVTMPSEEYRVGISIWGWYAKTYHKDKPFMWVIDYPMAARELQLALYGSTNINIGADHVSAVDLVKNDGIKLPDGGYGGGSSGGSYSGGSGDIDDPEDEPISEQHTGTVDPTGSSEADTTQSHNNTEDTTDRSFNVPTLPDIEITKPNIDVTLPWDRNNEAA